MDRALPVRVLNTGQPADPGSLVTAHGDAAEVTKSLEVRGALGFSVTDADPASCKEHAAALDDAIAKVPVSIAYHRMAMLCAEAIAATAALMVDSAAPASASAAT